MATPIIQLDGSISGAGAPGVSRDDFDAAPEVITVIDTANPAPTTFSVILRAKPSGSAAVISPGPGANEAEFTMDVDGTYLLEVITDGTSSGVTAVLGGQDFFFSTQGGAASKLPNGKRPLAAGETIQYGPDGWAVAMNLVVGAALSSSQFDAVNAASPAPSGANPFVTEGNAELVPVSTQANIPTADQKDDLIQLDNAPEGTIWYADGSAPNRVTRLAPGALFQVLETGGPGGAPPFWADKTASISAQLTATGTTNITAVVDTVISGMTIVPGAGDFFVFFNSSGIHNATNEDLFISLYVNGVQVPHTERRMPRGGAADAGGGMLLLIAFISGVLAAQVVEIRARVTAGDADIFQRTYTLVKAQ